MATDLTAKRDIPSISSQFQRYVESGLWQCPKGDAHHWIHVEGDTWRCRKCNIATEFKCPDYAWNDRMDMDALFGVSGLFDSLQRQLTC